MYRMQKWINHNKDFIKIGKKYKFRNGVEFKVNSHVFIEKFCGLFTDHFRTVESNTAGLPFQNYYGLPLWNNYSDKNLTICKHYKRATVLLKGGAMNCMELRNIVVPFSNRDCNTLAILIRALWTAFYVCESTTLMTYCPWSRGYWELHQYWFNTMGVIMECHLRAMLALSHQLMMPMVAMLV